MREIKQWSQEEMAEKMNMSLNGYARIERGETKLNLEKLQQISNIFNLDVIELLDSSNKGLFLLLNENGEHNNSVHYYSNGNENEDIKIEYEKLKVEVKYKNELLLQKDKEIEMLRKMLAMFEEKE